MDVNNNETLVTSDSESALKLRRYRSISRQIRRLETRLEELTQRNAIWSWARVMSFVIGTIAAVSSLFQYGQLIFWGVLVLGMSIFWGIVAVHRRLESSLTRHQRWRALKEMQLAQMRIDWNALPHPRAKPDFGHPYQADLDLVGERSIACLIDLSFTEAGGERLRKWLSGPLPSIAEIERRQRLVRELRPRHLLRMQLFVNADSFTERDNSRSGWDSTQLENWVTHLSTSPLWRYWLWAGWILAGLNFLFLGIEFVLGGARIWPYSWGIYALFVLTASILGATGSDSQDVFDDAMRLRAPFEQLVALFKRLESYSYRNAPEFQKLCAPFLDEQHRPSRYLNRLLRIVNATGMRGNPLIWLALNLLMPWDIHFTYALDRCKAEIGHYLPIWLDVWAEVETLNSLASLGYLNPDYVFPNVTESVATNNGASSGETSDSIESSPAKATKFEAYGLAHPLLPDLGLTSSLNTTEQKPQSANFEPVPFGKVANDFVVTELGEVRLITGSNMAGKSTFLRTIGLNMALAYAGAPVNASALTLERFRIFSSINVTDSVTDGISYFYAEVKRLRLLLDVLKEKDGLPVFFFIDEIYRGTNNRERLIGSRSYIRALVGMNGVGLISTHDLDLVSLADETTQIRNYHFRDEVINDRMHFDYKLRPGPCPTTNALKIMAMEGLPAGDNE